jgi:GTPase KRas protein
MIDSKPALLDVLDTAGQEEYASLQDQWIREGDGYLIVYSITNTNSLEEAKVLREKIVRIRDDDDFPLVLAGNKCDLQNERQVDHKTGKEVADGWNCPFYETSAKTKHNSETCFFAVVQQIRKLTQKTNAPTKKGGFCTVL